MLSYSHSNACPLEKQKFYLTEAKESFEIGLLSKRDKEPITSKQELHSFIKAAFGLMKVHQWLYGESKTLSHVSQLCREALKKLYAYSYLPPTEDQDKETLAKEIMVMVMSAKEQLQVQSFLSSDVRSCIPDSYKIGIEKPIVNSELTFEKVLKRYSQHHTAVCEVFKSACKSQETRKGEGGAGACITALKTETRNIDTMCIAEERSCCGKDTPKISVSQRVESHEGIKDSRRKKLPRVAALDVSLDEETESELSESARSNSNGITSRSQSGGEISSSLSSWSKLSGFSSSASWEEIDYNEKELPQEKEQRTKSSSTGNEQGASMALTETAEENVQGCDLSLLSSTTHNLSLKEILFSQTECVDSFKYALQNNVASANRLTESRQNFIEQHLVETEDEDDALKPFPGEASSINYPLSYVRSPSSSIPSSEQDPLGMTVPSPVMESKTKNSKWHSSTISNQGQCSIGKHNKEPTSCKQDVKQISRNQWPVVDPEGETVETTEDAQMNPHLSGETGTSVSLHSVLNPERDHFVQNWIDKSSIRVISGSSSEIPEVDPQADTVDDWEFASGSGGKSVDGLTDMNIRVDQPNPRSVPINSPSGKHTTLANQSSECTTTEEDEDEKRRNVLNKSYSSSSSLKSGYKSLHFSSSFFDLESPSVLDSSGSSFAFMSRTKEQMLHARILSDEDYKRLLSGVEHTWLVQRLKHTGLFKPNLLHKAHCK